MFTYHNLVCRIYFSTDASRRFCIFHTATLEIMIRINLLGISTLCHDYESAPPPSTGANQDDERRKLEEVEGFSRSMYQNNSATE